MGTLLGQQTGEFTGLIRRTSMRINKSAGAMEAREFNAASLSVLAPGERRLRRWFASRHPVGSQTPTGKAEEVAEPGNAGLERHD